MFHLLVASGGWREGGGTLSNSRIYLRSDNASQRLFLNQDGSLSLNKIRDIPALLVAETDSDDHQLARVAYINRLQVGARETEIGYAIDNSIHPISNQDLERIVNPGRFGLRHTCWSLEERDLFRMLLLNQQNNALSPNVFSVGALRQQDQNLVSVMMPFSMNFNNVYTALQGAVTACGLRYQRADNFWEDNTIIQDIVTLIAKARIVICDCTDRNPNVFYEAGIAHTLGKAVILITQNEADIPFDLRHLRYIRYLNNTEGLQRLTTQVQERIQTLIRG